MCVNVILYIFLEINNFDIECYNRHYYLFEFFNNSIIFHYICIRLLVCMCVCVCVFVFYEHNINVMFCNILPRDENKKKTTIKLYFIKSIYIIIDKLKNNRIVVYNCFLFCFVLFCLFSSLLFICFLGNIFDCLYLCLKCVYCVLCVVLCCVCNVCSINFVLNISFYFKIGTSFIYLVSH